MAQASAAAAGLARNELAYAVSQGYYGVLQAQSLAAVQQEQVRSLRESLRVARERLERGAAVRGDVLGLEVRLAQAEEELISAGSAVELAIAGLNTAIGRELVPPAGLDQPSPASVPDLPAAPAHPSAADHPAVVAAAAAAAATQSAVAKARAEFRPTVSAFADFGWDTADLTDPQDSYLAGVMVEWDVFDGARRSAAVHQARAQRDAAAAEARRARDGVLLEQRQAYLQARDARERLGVASKSVEAAEEGLRITRARYEQGAAAVAELVDAEVALAAVRSRGVVARYSYLTALANIERARGTLAPAGAAR
jgi:outer membrane protein TolC